MDPTSRWASTWDALGTAAPAGLLDDLLRAYAEPHRAYHTLHHLGECFDLLDSAPVAAERPGELELALWFHDAVYDTKASDSEERSAVWARDAVATAGGESGAGARVAALVLATKHEATPADADQALLVDLDLSILGSSAKRFAEYEAQVREEYAWVPEAAFRSARVRILRGFRERDPIYSTTHFRTALTERAKQNLDRSLAALSDEDRS